MKKIRRILYSKEVKGVIRNVFNFSVFQLTNALIPFLVLPYIVRIIGVEKFGILSLAIAVTYYMQLVVQYGFNISGIQKLASNINNDIKIAEIYKTITFIKSIAAFSLFVFLSMLLFLLKISTTVKLVYLFSFLTIPASILQSVWFFSGIEQMKYMNYSNLISRIFYLVSIFIFIQVESDFYLVPLLNSISMIFGGLFATHIILKMISRNFSSIKKSIVKSYIKEDWNVFVSNVGMNLYRNSNVFILGLIGTAEVVGLYAAAEKIVKMVQMIFIPITNVFFPFFSRHKKNNLMKSLKMFKITISFVGIGSLLLSVGIAFFADFIISFFYGISFIKSTLLLQIAAVVVFAGIMNNMLGFIFMMNFSMRKELKNGTIITGLLNIAMCFSLSYLFQEVGAALAFAVAEMFLLVLFTHYIQSRKKNWIAST